MAELVLQIKDSPKYEEGDILCAFNDRQILWKNAENLFWPRVDNDSWKPKVKGFLGNSYPVLQSSLEKIYRYKFERVARQEVVRIDLWSGEVDVLSLYSRNNELYMDVVAYIKDMKRGGLLFGQDGNEVWYDGPTDYSMENMERVWDGIEYYLGEGRENWGLWPAGREDLKHFFFISVSNFEDNQASELIVPLFEESIANKNKLKQKDNIKIKIKLERQYSVLWRELPQLSFHTENMVLDKDVKVDIRKKIVFDIDDLLQIKGKKMTMKYRFKPGIVIL